MRRVILPLACVAAIGFGAYLSTRITWGSPSPKSVSSEQVSLRELIETPARYDGKRVVVQGYLGHALAVADPDAKSRGLALHPTRESADAHITKDAVGVGNTPETHEIAVFIGYHVAIDGRFYAAGRSHRGEFKGTITALGFEPANRD